jgi:RimJ/RimL family protein N-acetyltransferase
MQTLIELTHWDDLSETEKAAVRHISVSSQQIEFAGTIDRAVEAVEAGDTHDIAGLAIQSSGIVVGFLVLKRKSKAPKWATPGAAVISAMRIDQAHQGKGFGSAALMALCEWVAANWPDSIALSLSVDEENIAGIRAYGKAAFADHGIREQGRIGWVRYMSRPITPAQ